MDTAMKFTPDLPGEHTDESLRDPEFTCRHCELDIQDCRGCEPAVLDNDPDYQAWLDAREAEAFEHMVEHLYVQD